MTGSAEKRTYHFEGFHVDPMRRILVRDGETVPITPKAFSILLALIERRGEVVAKEELIRQVWASTYVTEANLTQNVSSLRKALGEKAEDSRFVVTVPGQGYTFAVPVEVREESGFFNRLVLLPPGVEEPVAEQGLETPSASVAVRPVRRVLWIGVGLVAVILLAGIAFSAAKLADGPQEGLGSARQPARPSVAVLGFKDLSPDEKKGQGTAWIGPALAEMLSTELAADPRVRVVSRADVARARSQLKIQPSGTVDDEALSRIQRIVGAEHLVAGTYLALPDSPDRWIRLDVRVLRPGEVVASVAEQGRESELFDLVARTGVRLRRALGYEEPSAEQVRAARALQPADPEAMHLYAQGRERLHAYDASKALELLQRAADADPGSAVIRSALAQALDMIGYDARAVEQAEKAVELSSSLPGEERLGMQARLQALRQDWQGASATYRSLWTFYPDDLEYGLQLAHTLLRAGRYADGRETLAALHRLPAPQGEDPRIDLLDARLAWRSSDKPAQLRAAKAAIDKSQRSGEALLFAQALSYRGDALLAAGDAKGSILDFQKAGRLARREGHLFIEGMVLSDLGRALEAQGDLAGAEKAHREALGIAEKLGSLLGIASQHRHLGGLHQRRGELGQALDEFEQALVLFRRMNDRLMEARTLSSMGEVLAAQGDRAGARQRFELALQNYRGLDDQRGTDEMLAQLARLDAHGQEASEGR